MPILQLIYKSRAAALLQPSEVEQILQKSQDANSQRAITGLLLFSGGHFLQLLEGPKEDVHRVYSKIVQDERHTNVETLIEIYSGERRFGSWSMAYANPETVNESWLESLSVECKALQRQPEPDTQNLWARLLSLPLNFRLTA